MANQFIEEIHKVGDYVVGLFGGNLLFISLFQLAIILKNAKTEW
ncbi:MAG: hypothetical protein QGM50_03135 [Anaerolineae bacterium]|nr:hypothetical protein [Anaerolineae bacterium]MDK1081560.1 hypothetical protein [Anaerolineae bacterium]MDK1117765.1 hypothetical protein [Anaerolineae bacterium]